MQSSANFMIKQTFEEEIPLDEPLIEATVSKSKYLVYNSTHHCFRINVKNKKFDVIYLKKEGVLLSCFEPLKKKYILEGIKTSFLMERLKTISNLPIDLFKSDKSLLAVFESWIPTKNEKPRELKSANQLYHEVNNLNKLDFTFNLKGNIFGWDSQEPEKINIAGASVTFEFMGKTITKYGNLLDKLGPEEKPFVEGCLTFSEPLINMHDLLKFGYVYANSSFMGHKILILQTTEYFIFTDLTVESVRIMIYPLQEGIEFALKGRKGEYYCEDIYCVKKGIDIGEFLSTIGTNSVRKSYSGSFYNCHTYVLQFSHWLCDY